MIAHRSQCSCQSSDLPDPLPDPFFYTSPGLAVTTAFSDYGKTLNKRDVVKAALKLQEETIHIIPDPNTPMGTDEKFAEAGNAALVIRPNEKMTWEMYKTALLCICEVYHPRLTTESDLLFTDDNLRARVGNGFVRLLGPGLLTNGTTQAKSFEMDDVSTS